MSEQGGISSKPASKERDLIAGALRQATPRSRPILPAIDNVPRDSFPGYDIVREIHRGGQGVVYQAIQKSTNQKVAIKVIREGPFATSKERQRFEREIHILGQLNHPNIVGIHDSGQSAGVSYVVMDYIHGQNLDAYLASSKLSIDDILKLFTTICSAVNEAHLRGVVHRDLKPGNILVDANGQPHILDFGLAKLAVHDPSDDAHVRAMTMTGQFLGSLPWASPEQAMGTPSNIDIRTDVYSLGVILYHMLTGKFPYKVVGNMREVLDNILKAEPAKPSTIRRQINNEVETIVLKCLSKERERRYQSAGELARDIAHYLAGEPIEAKRDSGWYVISKTLTRYRWQAAAAALFLVTLLGFALWMSILYKRTDDARQFADQKSLEADQARLEESRQKAIAQKNFDAARALARTFMFEFNESIDKLRGTTRSRELILAAAKNYLELLEKADPLNAKDPAFRRDLANAYERVGDLQWRLFGPRTGSKAGALDNFRKSREIRLALADELPNDPQSHEDLAESARRAATSLHADRQYPKAEEEFAKALAELQLAIRSLAPSEAPRAELLADRRQDFTLELVETLTRAAEESTRDADQQAPFVARAKDHIKDAEIYWASRQSKSPGELRPRKELARCLVKRSKLEMALATTLQRECIAAAERNDAEVVDHLLPKVLERFRQAGELAKQAVGEFERLAAEYPANADVQQSLGVAHHEVGRASMESAETLSRAARASKDARLDERRTQADAFHAAALESFTRAFQVAKALADSDEANIDPRRDMAVYTNKVANELRDLNRLQDALEAFERSLSMRKDLVRTDDTIMHRRDLALALFKRGEIEALLADKLDDGAKQAERYHRALDFLAQSKAEFDALRNKAALDDNAVEFEAVRKKLLAINAKLDKLRGG